MQLTDLQILMEAVAAAVKRGAFDVNEAHVITSAYMRVSEFMKSAVPPPEATESKEDSTEATESKEDNKE